MNLFIKILSPEGEIFKDEIDYAIFPGIDGLIEVLPNHTPIFTKLTEGEITIKKKNENIFIAITGGFLEVSNNQIILLADYAIRSDKIIDSKVEEARKKAEIILKTKKDKKDFVFAEKELKKSILALKISEKIKKRIKR